METFALQTGRYRGTLLLADISGYTSFLEGVRVAHESDAFADGQIPEAYGLMSSLLEGIAADIDPPMTFVKFEGDAVFAVADEDASPFGDAMLECVDACYSSFSTRLEDAGAVWSCACDACARKDSLDLKFIVHFGEFVVQSVGRHTDVLGPDVNLAHRLMKNDAASRMGSRAYALFSQATVDSLGLSLPDHEVITQEIDDMDATTVRVVALTP